MANRETQTSGNKPAQGKGNGMATRGQVVYGTVRARIRAEGANNWVVCWNEKGIVHKSHEGRYDGIGLAKDLVFNPGFTNITLIAPNGRIYDETAIKAMQY